MNGSGLTIREVLVQSDNRAVCAVANLARVLAKLGFPATQDGVRQSLARRIESRLVVGDGALGDGNAVEGSSS